MPTNNESNTSPRKVQAVVKQAKALELRLQGHTLQHIAGELGYSSHGGVHYAIQKALESLTYEKVEDFRKLTLERLTRILNIYWPSVENRSVPETRLVLEVLQQMRQVAGTDQPSRVEHSGPEGSPIKHEVITLDVTEVTGAFNALADAGVLRLETPGSDTPATVDAVYSAPSDA